MIWTTPAATPSIMKKMLAICERVRRSYRISHVWTIQIVLRVWPGWNGLRFNPQIHGFLCLGLKSVAVWKVTQNKVNENRLLTTFFTAMTLKNRVKDNTKLEHSRGEILWAESVCGCTCSGKQFKTANDESITIGRGEVFSRYCKRERRCSPKCSERFFASAFPHEEVKGRSSAVAEWARK